MLDALGTVMVVLAVLLLAFTVYLTVIGGVGTLTHERYEDCPRCHHHGMTDHGRIHPNGCPHGIRSELAHLWHVATNPLHLHHP